MTQADFAEAMGTSIQWVSRVETGENLTLTTIDKIARVLDVPIKSLFDEPRKEALVVKKGRPRKGQ
jgi:transcriptional regulator with XRE-family HTH domain